MYVGYLRFGENLIINNELTRGYAANFDCPLSWFQKPFCDTLNDALDESWPYDSFPPEELPWYDPKLASESLRFFGVYGIDFQLVQDSTRQVPTVEGITDGGVIGRTRKGMKRMRMRAILVAQGRDALDYGLAWLNASIDPDACGQVSSKCGTADIEWLADCPPPRGTNPPESDDAYIETVNEFRRFLRTSAAESGAIVAAEFTRDNFYGYEVEVDFVSETPHILGLSHTIPLDPASPSIIQDIVFNLVQTPSAELAGPDVVIQTNYATNPSAETNITGWAVTSTVITPAPSIAISVPPGDPAASGTKSVKTTVVATNTSTAGWIGAQETVALPAFVAGQKFSFNIWVFPQIVTGTAVITRTRMRIEWLDSGNAVIGTATSINGPVAGGAISTTGQDRPSNATQVRVSGITDLTSWSTGASLATFVDALLVTMP